VVRALAKVSREMEIVGEVAAWGVPLAEFDAKLTPAEFTARTWIVYSTPLVSPAMTSGLVVCAGEKAVKVLPSVEYS